MFRRGNQDRKRPSKRRTCLGAESLEGRTLLAVDFQLAEAIGVTGTGAVDIASNAVATDAAGDLFITGSLRGTADFDPGPGVQNLTSAGSRDIVLAEYSPIGTLLWARDLPGADGTSVGEGAGIAVDGAGNVVLTGSFSG